MFKKINLNNYKELSTYCISKGYKIIPYTDDYGKVKVFNENKNVVFNHHKESSRQILEYLKQLE